ncbi:hypothetical protein NA57DRAFT_66071 [Rhizodiscina lignyota]|uniref:DUF221-domain-containing protein n=1 Tax=Rhizodiscina lignyota TaxID=1504668 RepID=A0A9P4IG91_9PEZI|nr:hypothetical protein NA57DRAFT_66071 [Rhizodiscina lignyota]
MARRARSGGSSSTDEFLNLIADPFNTQVQANSIYAALIWSFAVSAGLFVVFCFLRPRFGHIYAPRAKSADEKHAPQRLERQPLGWIRAITVKEPELVDKIGLDAVVFLRFLRMIRNIFIVVTIFGCAVIIPINLVGGHQVYKQYSNIATLLKLTPQYIFGEKFWAFVACAYVFEAVICFFIWWNYRAVLRLRQAYFRSWDYTSSLHSRTLLLRHIPAGAQTDTGIAEIVSASDATDQLPRTAIGRNVRRWGLPELIEEHDEAVRKLEKYLAKYLADPNHLPEKRPLCKPSKKDKDVQTDANGKVDAIDYLTHRIRELKAQIYDARESIDKRDPESYGFASFHSIETAHAVAYVNEKSSSKKARQGVSIALAPKPHDILWQNLPMTRATRRNRLFWDSLWMSLLTAVFVIPNILTSVFLSDFSHLGLVWSSFQKNLEAHPTGWGIAQGIIAPAVQTLFYIALPAIFRRLLTHSGDASRTSRERHLTSRLYAFFVFNNLVIFSIFASAWRYAAAVIGSKDKGVWDALKEGHPFTQLMIGLCNVSTYWLTWQMQHNLSAATDLSQLWPLVLNTFKKRYMHPTPRELIELTAPQKFEYADYYNNFLFAATVGLCFATLQPIILPITAFYLGVEVWFKTYMLQYICFTKTESGGAFWRMLVNRLLFAILLSNAVIALVVGAQGVGSQNAVHNGGMLYAMIPLPFLLAGFKWYLIKYFDSKMGYISPNPALTGTDGMATRGTPSGEKTSSRLAVKFGHPALYKELITPMVHAKSQHLLAEVLSMSTTTQKRKGSVTEGNEEIDDIDFAASRPVLAYSESAIYMSPLKQDGRLAVPGGGDGSASESGSTAALVPGMEVETVSESDMDFERWKGKSEFRDEFGGDGEVFGRAEDADTPALERGEDSDQTTRFRM